MATFDRPGRNRHDPCQRRVESPISVKRKVSVRPVTIATARDYSDRCDELFQSETARAAMTEIYPAGRGGPNLLAFGEAKARYRADSPARTCRTALPVSTSRRGDMSALKGHFRGGPASSVPTSLSGSSDLRGGVAHRARIRLSAIQRCST
jgi:hypothetical protein